MKKTYNRTQGIIYFSKPNGRIMADVNDVCNWLMLEKNDYMAKELQRKAGGAEKKIDKSLKEKELERGSLIGKMEWGEPEKEEKIDDKITAKTWWKKLIT